MDTKLYVGNLSYSATEQELQELFGQAGTVVSATIIKDRETKRSKGFGFVEMSSDEEAQAAIAALNGQQHGGRALTVNSRLLSEKPLNILIAFSASAWLDISTKPKPLERLVSRSLMIVAETTVPA